MDLVTCTSIGQFKTYCMNVVFEYYQSMSYGVLCVFFTFLKKYSLTQT